MNWREMDYTGYIEFVLELLEQQQLPSRIIAYPYDEVLKLPLGYHLFQHKDKEVISSLKKIISSMESNRIYRFSDTFLCNYFAFLLPACDPTTIMVVGPYLTDTITPEKKLSVLHDNLLAPSMLSELDRYYEILPVFDSEDSLVGLLHVLGKRIWGNLEHFTFEEKQGSSFYFESFLSTTHKNQDDTDSIFRIETLQQRYDLENELLNAISKGHTHQAEMALHRFFASTKLEHRSSDPDRNAKNYLIILNTLFRKAAERGYVHPVHLDRLSSQLGHKIEESYQKFVSTQYAEAFAKDMIRKYTMLVKNHSLREYSDIVRQALTMITSDLTADLTLNSIATTLNVNASYLSTVFKKELGMTLTDYVTQKRVEHAIFLLNSTAMPISEISQFCGIPDVHYFSKIFKKQIGQSPSEYRKMLLTKTS